MGIMTRFVRLCKADIHGVMDQMEDKGLLLKQHLRDMQEELDKKESRLASMLASREETERERERRSREYQALEQDLALAIAKEKDDIARTLIRKLKPLGQHGDELRRHVEALDRDIAQFRTAVEEQRLLFEQLRLKAAEHLRRTEHMAGRVQADPDAAMAHDLAVGHVGAAATAATERFESLSRFRRWRSARMSVAVW